MGENDYWWAAIVSAGRLMPNYFPKWFVLKVQFYQSCMGMLVKHTFINNLLLCKTARHHGDVDIEDRWGSFVYRKQLESGINWDAELWGSDSAWCGKDWWKLEHAGISLEEGTSGGGCRMMLLISSWSSLPIGPKVKKEVFTRPSMSFQPTLYLSPKSFHCQPVAKW